jgi:hypothetical protein
MYVAWLCIVLTLARAQVTSLVSLNLMTRETSVSDLDNPKFKCSIGASTAFAVAKRLGVDLASLLHDPELHEV